MIWGDEVIVCFVDINIDRIVDYHCLNFLFIIMKRNKKLKVRKSNTFSAKITVLCIYIYNDW